MNTVSIIFTFIRLCLLIYTVKYIYFAISNDIKNSRKKNKVYDKIKISKNYNISSIASTDKIIFIENTGISCNDKNHCSDCHSIIANNNKNEKYYGHLSKNLLRFKCNTCKKQEFVIKRIDSINDITGIKEKVYKDYTLSKMLYNFYPNDFLNVCLNDLSTQICIIYENFDIVLSNLLNFTCTPESIFSIFKQIFYAHKKLIRHGNIAPSTVVKKENKYFLINFSNSYEIYKDNIKPKIINKKYTPPELLIDENEIYLDGDWWSFGVLIFYLSENKYPFKFDKEFEKMVENKNELKNKFKIFYNIENIKFNNIKDLELQNLILKLLTYNRNERLGTKEMGEDDILTHEYFKNIIKDKI